MKWPILFSFLFFSFLPGKAQDVSVLQEQARQFMRKNDYNNAILVLQNGLQSYPQHIALTKDLSVCLNAVGDHEQALTAIKSAIAQTGADDQCYQVAGKILKDLRRVKECEKLYKKGIRRFPNSGALLHEMGELLWLQQDYTAIQYWEKGIEKDPAYPKNYYHAAKFYYLTTNKVWSLIYGEIYVLMEPLSAQVPEIKDILLESYKKLFTVVAEKKLFKEKKSFAKNYLHCMQAQAEVVNAGIDLESLLMLRTRFILDWGLRFKDKYPFKLFEYQQQLLREGYYEAYHQWLFGAAFNLLQFQQWTQVHAFEYKAFLNFHQSRLFKLPANQYYR